MYNTMTILINKKFYATAEIAINKLSVFFAVNQITDEQYVELIALVNEVYGE